MTILKIKALVSRNRPLILVTVTLTTIFAVFQNCNQLNVPASTQNGLTTSHLPLQPQQSSSSSSAAPSLSTLTNLPSTAYAPSGFQQYDSDEIAFDSVSNKIIGAANSSAYGLSGGFYAETGWGFGGISSPTIVTLDSGSDHLVGFKDASSTITAPSSFEVTKIKLYTNLSATRNTLTYALQYMGQISYYDYANPTDFTNNNIVNNGPGGGGLYGGSYLYCNETIPGATLLKNELTPNIGDPGTCYSEVTVSGANNGVPNSSRIGDTPDPGNPITIDNQGQSIPVNSISSYYASMQIQTRQNLTGFKFRFMLEYQ